MQNIQSVIIIGTGKLAEHLSTVIAEKGYSVVQIYGRTESKAKTIAKNLSCNFTTKIEEIDATADLYIIAISDKAIADISKQMPKVSGIVVHTAGGVDMDVLKHNQTRFGVLYPLQSFSKGRTIDFTDTPFLIEGDSAQTVEKLSIFARTISEKVYEYSSEQRLKIHVAAVFASNFANHVASIAKTYLQDNNIDFSILAPLLKETYDKILSSNPVAMQTGPALRNDTDVMNKHLELLSSYPNFMELYRQISKSIYEFHQTR